jgi:hypothetical protein
MLFTGGDGSMMIEGIARQASGGSTVSLRTWIAPESIGASSARYFDVLYDLTETG